MPPSTPFSIAPLGRYKQLPQRSAETWQGGLVKLPAWIDDPEDPAGPPYRPVGAIWVSLRTGLMHVAPASETDTAGPDPDLALRALIEFGLKEAKSLEGRPSTIEVRDPNLQRMLSEALSGLNTTVVVREELPAVAEALRAFETVSGTGNRIPGALEGRGVATDDLRAFADAAAKFFEAAPWQRLSNEDLIVVESPHVPRNMRHVCVLGQGGEEFGLAFFDSRRAFESLFVSAPTMPKRVFGVTFGPIDMLPFADVDAWEELALPVAGPLAYPLAADSFIDGTMRRPDARELAAAEALLRALADTSEEELDSGSWSRSVAARAGTMTLQLSLPLLVEAERGAPGGPSRAVMPQLTDRTSARIARLFEAQSFDSLDDVNAALRRAMDAGSFDDDAETTADRPLTSLEQAQELAYDAMEATGRRRIKLARRALALSEDCADACVVLAQAASSPEEAREWYQRGVEAGERAIGSRQFADLAGKFWGQLETRPYMRARLGLAEVLYELGRVDEAIDHYRELLRLNPDDNQGVRYLLLPALLEQGRGSEADALLAAYANDIDPTWSYAEALQKFRSDGDDERARAALRKARASNAHAVGYLLDPDSIPPNPPPHFAMGSREEGAYVAESLHAAFEATPGALQWLQAGRRRSRAVRSSKSRSGKTRRRH